MRITELNKKITASALNESAARQFGQKLNLESFTLEQLEDARNKLRTKIYQFENNSGYTEVYENEDLAKNKLFLDVLNHAIAERQSSSVAEFTEMEQLVLDRVSEGFIEFAQLPEELQIKCWEASAGGEQALAEKAPEGWEGTVKAMKKHKDVDNPYALAHWMKGQGYKSHKKESVEESVLREGEEEKAELIMASRDMVERITGWMEDTANMQAESMLELIDSIRDELGSDVAMEFESVVKPALASVYTALESSRQQLTQGVGLLTGEGQTDMMGSDSADAGGDELDAGGDELDAGGDELDNLTGDDDEFATAAPAAGGDETAGRAKRESIDFSHRLMTILTSKKK
jgi:hypothetical protein